MPIHDCAGLRADGLQTYLAALGLIRIIREQADPDLLCWWEGGHLVLDTSVDDLLELLVERYRPLPAFSPWNGGSGFGEKDRNQRAAIQVALDAGGERFDEFRATFAAVEGVMQRESIAKAQGRPWDKKRLARELRNRVPEAALAWLDAVLVIGDDRLFYPAVFGTGGNDGRLEFSSNYHQRLADVLPELGAKPARSMALLRHALFDQEPVPLVAKPAGQFNASGAASPGTFAVGSGAAIVNPWLYVLSMEAAGMLVASASRSAGQTRSGASVPFTVRSSAAGPTPGSGKEKARGEFWAPVWADALRGLEVKQIFEQSRASWAGGTASNAEHMYFAVRSRGVDQRLTWFYRYGIAQRNGQSFMASLKDIVEVARRRNIAAAVPVEARMSAFSHASSDRAKAQVLRVNACGLAFGAVKGAAAAQPLMVDWLAALAEREFDVARSTRERDSVKGSAPRPPARDVIGQFEGWLDERPEHRLAACLASARLPGEDSREVALADLLIGAAPSRGRPWAQPQIPGFLARPLHEVLADVVVWRDHHATADDAGAGRGLRITTGHGYWCAPDDVYAWVEGRLDERLLDHVFLACLALDWSGFRAPRAPLPERQLPSLHLALISAIASGAIILPGHLATDPDTRGRQGWPRGWALRLRAGRVGEIMYDSAQLLNRSRLASARQHPTFASTTAVDDGVRHIERRASVTAPVGPSIDRELGLRLTAALLAPVSLDGLQRLRATHLVGGADGVAGIDDRQHSDTTTHDLDHLDEGVLR